MYIWPVIYCDMQWLQYCPGPTETIRNKYRQISNIGRTKYQKLNDSRFIYQLPLPNPLKPGVKSRMKM